MEQADGRIIPLTSYLAELLIELKVLANERDAQCLEGEEESSPWVFRSTRSATGYVSDPGVAHRLALRDAGLPHVTLHGLRRSFGTLSEWIDVPVGVVAQIQGHKPSAIAGQTYFPEGVTRPGWYQPTDRGVERRLGEKLAWLRSFDDEMPPGGDA